MVDNIDLGKTHEYFKWVAKEYAGQGRVKGEHGFMEVAAFFGILVWSVPLFLFLSLSANDNALPSSESIHPSFISVC